MENIKNELNQIRSLFNELKKQDSSKLELLKNNPENENVGKDENHVTQKSTDSDFEDYEQ